MSKTVEEIVEIIKEVKEQFYARQNDQSISFIRRKATHSVAASRGISYTTVIDKISRYPELEVSGLKGARAFDRLLEDWLVNGSNELRNILTSKEMNVDDVNLINGAFTPEIKDSDPGLNLAGKYLEKFYTEELDSRIKKSRETSKYERQKRLKYSDKKPKVVWVYQKIFDRNPDVIVEVLERAKGLCESCRDSAPFLRACDGTPYLEVHHKIPLSEGGEDTVENGIALCPNCHRKAHYG